MGDRDSSVPPVSYDGLIFQFSETVSRICRRLSRMKTVNDRCISVRARARKAHRTRHVSFFSAQI